MKVPPIPVNELSRLAVLHTLEVLDTPEEDRFDRLTRIARKVFNVPISLVSLIDENRQWFKSCNGLGQRETARDISFCGHAILEDGIFCIEDAKKDPRFSDNPLVLESPFIRFYAGCPLKVLDAKIGTLCIIDRVPRALSTEDRTLLKDLSALVENELLALHLATIDDLTSIPNRRGTINLLRNGISLSRRHGVASTLVFFDLNHFKLINDQYGHEEGDFVLKSFASMLKQAGREADIFGRLGGDEFIAWFGTGDTFFLPTYLKRLEALVDSFNANNSKSYVLDFAYGSLDIDPQTQLRVEEMLSKADTLMYKNKHE